MPGVWAYLGLDTVLPELQDLLPATTEQEGVTNLETHHILACTPTTHVETTHT